MEKQEFINIVNKHLAGQGTQIDVAGVLPKLFLALAEWFDADAVNHFMVLGGEMADDVASIQLLFSDEMVLTYTEGGTITYKEL